MARTATRRGDPVVSIESTEDRQRDTDDLTEADIYAVLSNTRRRHALQYLYTLPPDEEGPTLRELARHVAAKETDSPIEAVEAEARRRVQIAFHQTHLPTLEDHELVTYDESTKTLALTDRAQAIRPYLDVTTTESGSWPTVNVGLGVGGLVVAVALTLNFDPVAVVGGGVWVGVISGLLLAVGSLQRLDVPVPRPRG